MSNESSKPILTAPEAQAYARRWHVSTRTIFSWRAAGVDLSDPINVAEFLTNQKHVPEKTLLRALEIVKTSVRKLPKFPAHQIQ